MKPTALFLLLALSITPVTKAQIDGPGDAMIVGFNADGNDGIAFVLLQPTPNGTAIRLTDNEWNGTAFTSGEGHLLWTNDTGGALTGGTVVVLSNLASGTLTASTGAVSATSGTTNLSGSDEGVLLYLGTESTPTAFLTAFANNTFANASISLANTGLTEGTDAIAISGDEDVIVYNGSTVCNTTQADCASALSDATNFITQDGTGDQSNDTTAPDFPTDVVASFSGSALPVELVAFDAHLSGDTATLMWTTAGETNNAGFSVERRFAGTTDDGRLTTDWDEAGWINGRGTTTERQTYRHTVAGLVPGRHVFRLRQVDFDGAFAYSPTVEVTVALSGVFAVTLVRPNPATPEGAGLSVAVRRTQAVAVEVYDVLGRRVAVPFAGAVTADAPVAVRVGGLSPGLYVVRVAGERFVHSQKLTVVR